jgi:uncharacterized protein DUF2786
MMDTAVVERIKKLLKLSTSSNEHEAALAAQRASELMRAHNIAEAQLRVEEPAAARGPEPINRGATVDIGGKRTAKWKGHLVSASARLYNCHVWLDTSGEHKLFGREPDVQAATYTAHYLIAEVDRIAKAAWAASPEKALDSVSGRSWLPNFCLGAAVTIWHRCSEVSNERLAKARAAAAAAAAGPVTALMVVAKDELEVYDEYKRFSRGFRTARSGGGRVTQASAYDSGRAAGASVNLGGGNTRGLGAGQGRLR